MDAGVGKVAVSRFAIEHIFIHELNRNTIGQELDWTTTIASIGIRILALLSFVLHC